MSAPKHAVRNKLTAKKPGVPKPSTPPPRAATPTTQRRAHSGAADSVVLDIAKEQPTNAKSAANAVSSTPANTKTSVVPKVSATTASIASAANINPNSNLSITIQSPSATAMSAATTSATTSSVAGDTKTYRDHKTLNEDVETTKRRDELKQWEEALLEREKALRKRDEEEETLEEQVTKEVAAFRGNDIAIKNETLKELKRMLIKLKTNALGKSLTAAIKEELGLSHQEMLLKLREERRINVALADAQLEFNLALRQELEDLIMQTSEDSTKTREVQERGEATNTVGDAAMVIAWGTVFGGITLGTFLVTGVADVSIGTTVASATIGFAAASARWIYRRCKYGKEGTASNIVAAPKVNASEPSSPDLTPDKKLENERSTLTASTGKYVANGKDNADSSSSKLNASLSKLRRILAQASPHGSPGIRSMNSGDLNLKLQQRIMPSGDLHLTMAAGTATVPVTGRDIVLEPSVSSAVRAGTPPLSPPSVTAEQSPLNAPVIRAWTPMAKTLATLATPTETVALVSIPAPASVSRPTSAANGRTNK